VESIRIERTIHRSSNSPIRDLLEPHSAVRLAGETGRQFRPQGIGGIAQKVRRGAVMKRVIPSLMLVAVVVPAVTLPAASSRTEPAADACLSKPDSAPPQGQHWYYRIERPSGRHCWYLGAQREKAKPLREAAPPKPPPALVSELKQEPSPEIKREPSPEPIIRTAQAVPEMYGQPEAAPISASAIQPPSLTQNDPDPDTQLQVGLQHRASEPAEQASTGPIVTAASPGTPSIAQLSFQDIVLLAAALALVGTILRSIFRLLLVRRLRRRRVALRRQWETAKATRPPRSAAVAASASAGRHADLARQRLAIAASIGIPRQRSWPQAPTDEPAAHAPREGSLLELLQNLRRAAA
jgi:hypothetical protein